jgi:ABC-2 type transport system ATP-binding protein
VSLNRDRTSISVPATDPVRTTRELLTMADEHGLAVSNISILKPTLDDVFLSLTGASASATSASVPTAEEVAA